MTEISGLRLAIDIGGMFTDTVLLNDGSGKLTTIKTPTTAPARGTLDGARHVLQLADVGWGQISEMIHGTTLATNALIERRGARVATITTCHAEGAGRPKIESFFDDMATEAKAVVRSSAANAKLTGQRVAFMRYHKQGHEIEIGLPPRTEGIRHSRLADSF